MVSRLLRVRLRSLLIVIAFLGLVFAVVVQTIRLQQAAVREARLQVELQQQKHLADASAQKARAVADQMLTQVAQQMAPPDEPRADMSRDSLKRSLKFYQGMESNASTPEARARASERVKQIRSQIEGQGVQGDP